MSSCASLAKFPGANHPETPRIRSRTHLFRRRAARQQTAAAIIVGGFFTDAVHFERGRRLVREVEDGGRLGLHLEGQIVGVDARGKFGIARLHLRLIQIADQAEGFAAVPPRGSRGQAEIEHRLAARTEHRGL